MRSPATCARRSPSAPGTSRCAPGSPGRMRITFLGTGIMGAPMARHLAQAGHDVRVWNRTLEKAQPLADDGATVCDSPADALQGADFLLTMLADADAVEES